MIRRYSVGQIDAFEESKGPQSEKSRSRSQFVMYNSRKTRFVSFKSRNGSWHRKQVISEEGGTNRLDHVLASMKKSPRTGHLSQGRPTGSKENPLFTKFANQLKPLCLL